MSTYLLKKYLRLASQFNKKTLRKAGPRYTPVNEPGFPNVTIEELETTFGLAQKNLKFYDQIKKHLEDLKRKRHLSLRFSVKNEKTSELDSIATQVNKNVEKLIVELTKTYIQRDVTRKLKIPMLLRISDECEKSLTYLQNEYEEASKIPRSENEGDIISERDTSLLRDVTTSDNDIFTILRNVVAFNRFLKSPQANLINHPYMVLGGISGTGKTHFLCDIANAQIKSNIPALVTLASDYTIVKDPLLCLIDSLGLKISKEKFLNQLDTLGEQLNERILIMFDAINESDKDGWKKSLKALISDLLPFRNIALVVSCRYPFQHYIIHKSARLVPITHPGFTGIEIDAQTEFFDYFKLPQPEVPLLTEEFSNPLFLKMMCRSLQRLKKGKHARLRDIASGQYGMTKILEDFVWNTSNNIVKKYKLERDFIWELYKRIAEKMGENKQEYLSVKAVLPLILHKQRRKILTDLFRDGLLLESMEYNADVKEYELVIKFPYQKFSDHLIARYLLKKYIPSIKEDLKHALKNKKIQKKLFRINEYGYYDFNLLEALMVEFPARIKQDVELLDFLPEDRVNHDVLFAFINSLLFRNTKSFGSSTNNWIKYFLGDKYWKYEVINTLVTLATKKGHPYCVERLDKSLQAMRLTDRDVFWSEYLRRFYAFGTITRILRWFEKSTRAVDGEQALIYMKLLMWSQTTTRHQIRDRASRALYFLGLQHPTLLFDLVIRSFSLNDPYVTERMIGVCYGVVLTILGEAKHKSMLANYARTLFAQMFKNNAPHYTNHILMREHAQLSVSIIHKKYDLFTKSESLLFTPPFKVRHAKSFRLNKKLTEQTDTHDRYPAGTDFGNYTVGSMFKERRSYENDYPGYMEEINLMQSRIYGLGYTAKQFNDIDADINSRGGADELEEAGRTEKYLKKYAWIAFYEIYGMRKDRGLIERNYINEPRHFPVSIDPTFPIKVKTEKIITTNFLGTKIQKDTNWIKRFPNVKDWFEVTTIYGEKGPWILLEGIVNRENVLSGRHVYANIHTTFVINDDIQKIPSSYYTKDSHRLGPLFDFCNTEARSVYAGEIPNTNIYPRIKKSTVKIYNSKNKRVREKYKILKNGIEVSSKEKYKLYRVLEKIEKDREAIRKYFNDNNLTMQQRTDEENKIDTSFYVTRRPTLLDVSWGDFESPLVTIGSIQFPIKDLCQTENLSLDLRTLECKDSQRKNATKIINFEPETYNQETLLYIRKDILHSYMKKRDYKLLIMVWGNKKLHPKRASIYEERSYTINEIHEFKRVFSI